MRGRAVLLLLVLAAGLAGCTLGPDPGEAPATAADEAARFAEAPEGPKGETPPPDDWWRHFADPVTVQLVEEALEANPDLRAAAARVMESEAALGIAHGARLPQVDFTLNASRNKFSMVLPQVGRIGIYSTTFNDQLQVSYLLDIFGKLKRGEQAAWADMMATEANRKAVVNALVANVIRARVRIAMLEEQLDVATATAESWRSTAALVRDRYEAGIADAAELHLTENSLAQAEAAIPRLRRSIAAARHALDVLLGRRPGSGTVLPDTLPPVPDLDPVPPGLPAALLDRRPDLVAARMRFSSATARVGVALANLYPNLTLSASGGFTGNEASDLTKSSNIIYNAAMGILAPIFHGGQLRANVEAAQARMEEAAASYASAVLTALREVEDALSADRELQAELESARLARDAAVSAEALMRLRYEYGTVELLDLLNADRTRRFAENALIQVRSQLWDARVGLFLALGGDWESAVPRPEDPQPEAPRAGNDNTASEVSP